MTHNKHVEQLRTPAPVSQILMHVSIYGLGLLLYMFFSFVSISDTRAFSNRSAILIDDFNPVLGNHLLFEFFSSFLLVVSH
jgi:hypothetical protein